MRGVDPPEGAPGDVRVPAELRAALREWSEVVDTVLRSGDPEELDLLRRRGRQLAGRVADALGRTVEFVDPVSGTVETIRSRAEPTPWGTGAVVAAYVAVLVAVADVLLADAVAAAFGLLWLPANLLVTAGAAPSLWRARTVTFWRWPAFGAAAGLAAAWVVLLLRLLA